MAIQSYLSTLKSSGTYLFEFDQSQIVTNDLSTLRLVVGFSKKGVFNTPVYCENISFFNEIFGTIDKSLEKRGSFFHRTCENMLQDSPIIVLNLRILDEDLDRSEFISFSTTCDALNQFIGDAPISKFYNTDKFWKLDTENTLQNIDNQEGFTKSLLNFSNVGTQKVSLLVTNKKINGLDILAKDWYGEGNVPEFLDDYDYINDYAVSVQVIKGDFSDYEKLSIDPLFGDYFDINGIKKIFTDKNGNTFDGLRKFLQLKEVVVLGTYDGVLIPNFVDKFGNDIYIQNIINLDAPFTGVYCAVNEELFDLDLVSGVDNGVDLIGNTLNSSTLSVIDFLSYYGTITENLEYVDGDLFNEVLINANTIDNIIDGSYTGSANAILSLTDTSAYTVNTNKYDTLTIYSPDSIDPNAITSPFTSQSDFIEFAKLVESDKSLLSGYNQSFYGLVEDVYYDDNKLIVKGYNFTDTTLESFIDGSTLDLSTDISLGLSESFNSTRLVANELLVTVDSKLGQDVKSGVITSSDTIEVLGNIYEDITIESYITNGSDISTLGNSTSHSFVAYKITATNDILSPIKIKSAKGNINEEISVTKVNDYEFTIDNTNGDFTGKILPDDFILRGFEVGSTISKIDPRTNKTRFTRIVSVREDSVTKIITVKCINKVFFDNGKIQRYKSIDNFVTNYQFSTLEGYSLRSEQVPNGTDSRQKEILDVLINTNLFRTLADSEAINFRYIVDSFEGTIEPFSKSVLSDLCRERQYAFAILNAPSVKKLSKSTNPLFKFDARSNYDSKYFASGGNQTYNPSNVFSLPSVELGSNYCAFYHPNLTVREGNSVISVPPSSYISNNFLEKYRSYKPYSIVAGIQRGTVSGNGIVNVEYEYDRNDLDNLEPFGINTIIKRNGQLVINSNQTAQQNIQSALSKVHVRELLIHIEERVDNVLKQYVFEFNTPQTRLEIKTIVDGILSNIQNDGGLNAFETVMNSSNNTSEIIDSSMGIIDIIVEPVKGLEKLVQRVTILKTGGIQRGEFQIV